MEHYISGSALRTLRERAGLTQRALGEQIGVTDKAVSKWETGRGLPDVTLLDSLAKALGVSVAELLAGEQVVNRNRAGNLNRMQFYVCPVCGNVLTANGEASISCCGVQLPPLEAEEAEGCHALRVERVENELWVTMEHPMTKEHFISFLALVTSDRVQLVKLYPEQTCGARFTPCGRGTLYACCNRHGLVKLRYK